MTKLGIITVETLMVEKNKQKMPTIVLIGRDETGKKRMWRTIFWPYMYLTEEDYIRIKDQKGYSLSKWVKDFEGTKVRSLNKKALTKLILTDSLCSLDVIKFLIKYGKTSLSGPVFSYEADLAMPTMLPIRFLIDKGIRSGVNISKDGELTPIDFVINLRKWHLDFEALSTKQCGSGPKKGDPIPIMSFHDNYNDTLYTLLVVNPKWPKSRRDAFHYGFKTVYKTHSIMGFKNEGLLLEALIRLVNELDPDLFSAWNLDRYDIVKWTQRMTEQHLDPKTLSPFRSFSWKRLPYRIKGRILFDLMKAFKRFTDAELRSYGLGAISEEEGLAIEKVPLKKPTQWIWDNDPDVLFRRNVNDVLILKALDDKYELIEMFDDLRREFGALFHEVLLNYRVLDTALMRFVSGKIALNTAFKAKKSKDSYLGAVVVEPEPGEYSFIAQFDFQREYPSLIKAFNIGPETYRDENYTGPCYTIGYKGKVFKFVKSPKSLLAQLIDFFFHKRDEYEGYYQKAIESKDEVKIKMWYRKIFNIKKMTNAIYGVMDYPSFRLYRQECSAATAILGRIGIEEIILILEPLGYKLIYGDTDSSFVPLKSKVKEEAVKEAQWLAEQINKGLSEYFRKTYGLPSSPSGLGVKKVYDSFLLIAKKNYAGRSFWDEKRGYKVDYDFKGLEVIRSDSSSFEKEIMEKIVRMVLDGFKSDIGGVKDDALLRVSSRTLDPLMVSYPLQISGNLEDYPKPDKNGKLQMPAHIRAAVYSNMNLNTDYGREDKPRRLPIQEMKTFSSHQSTLFQSDVIYPSECQWKGFNFKLAGISITEDSEIPEWFIERIDWERIKKRLAGKIDKIMGLVKVGVDP